MITIDLRDLTDALKELDQLLDHGSLTQEEIARIIPPLEQVKAQIDKTLTPRHKTQC